MKKLILTIILLLSLTVFAANEVQFYYDSTGDPNLYVIITKPSDATVWDNVNSAWHTWSNPNEPNYALVLDNTHKDYYDVNFPSGIGAGAYPLSIYKRSGSDPNITDDLIVGTGEIAWDGSTEITDYVLWQDTNEIQVALAEGGNIESFADDIPSIETELHELYEAWGCSCGANSLSSLLNGVDANLTIVLADTAAVDTTAEMRTFLTGSDTTIATQAKQDTIIADTNENQTDWTDGGRLDTIIDSILTDTGTTLDDFLDTEIAAILADSNELQTDWTNGGRLDLIIDAILADGNDIQEDWATVVAQVADVNTDTDTLLVDVNDVETTVEALPTAAGVPVGQ